MLATQRDKHKGSYMLSRRRTIPALLLALALVLVGSSLPAYAANPSRDIAPDDGEEQVRVTVPLAHPTDLRSAVEYGTKFQGLAYAFDNGGVVGEYAPGSGQSVDEYLDLFRTEYGTSPAVTGIVVVKSRSQQQSKASSAPIGEELPTITPPPVQYGGETLRRKTSTSPISADAVQARSAGDWRPDASAHELVPDTATTGLIYQEFVWTAGGLYSLPDRIGLEFEINLDNEYVTSPNSTRPNCSDGSYKDRFWLKNSSYSWSVSDMFSSSASTLGAYADYNDLSDTCRKNSIAVGMRYPKNMQSMDIWGVGLETRLEVLIVAPRGLTTYSKVGGNVQAVTASACENYPWMALTDCMGVNRIDIQWNGYPSGNYNRSTLNVSRGWIAPSLCWRTWNTGANLVSYTCP